MLCKICGFHGGDCEECRLLGCYAAAYVGLLDNANVSSSPILVTLMMDVLGSFETTLRTTAAWQEDILHSHHREILKS
jgi:hypothetical protein